VHQEALLVVCRLHAKTFPGPSVKPSRLRISHSPARLAIHKRACGIECREFRCKVREPFSRPIYGAGNGKIPAWFFHLVSSSDLRISCAALLQWSRICSCYLRPVVLKGETSKTPECSTPYAGNREDISLATE